MHSTSISYEVKSLKKVIIDNNDWYDINDEVEIIATITKSSSYIKDVDFKINNNEYSYTEIINDINNAFTVTLKIPLKDYLQSNENELRIVGYVEGESGNNNNSQDIYTCYIDKEDPEISIY